MAKFVIRKNVAGEYWFVMHANNNKTVLQSETYKSKQGAQNGIQAIKQEAASAQVVDDTATNKQQETKIEGYSEH